MNAHWMSCAMITLRKPPIAKVFSKFIICLSKSNATHYFVVHLKLNHKAYLRPSQLLVACAPVQTGVLLVLHLVQISNHFETHTHIDDRLIRRARGAHANHAKQFRWMFAARFIAASPRSLHGRKVQRLVIWRKNCACMCPPRLMCYSLHHHLCCVLVVCGL